MPFPFFSPLSALILTSMLSSQCSFLFSWRNFFLLLCHSSLLVSFCHGESSSSSFFLHFLSLFFPFTFCHGVCSCSSFLLCRISRLSNSVKAFCFREVLPIIDFSRLCTFYYYYYLKIAIFKVMIKYLKNLQILNKETCNNPWTVFKLNSVVKNCSA